MRSNGPKRPRWIVAGSIVTVASLVTACAMAAPRPQNTSPPRSPAPDAPDEDAPEDPGYADPDLDPPPPTETKPS